MVSELTDTDIPLGHLGQADYVVYRHQPPLHFFHLEFLVFSPDIFLYSNNLRANPGYLALFLYKIAFERFLPFHALVMHCHNPFATKNISETIQIQKKQFKKFLHIEPARGNKTYIKAEF